MIDSFNIICDNRNIKANVDLFIESINKKNKEHPFLNKPFNIFYLDELRTSLAKKLRDSGYFGYSASNISYIVDTNEVNKTAKLKEELFNQATELQGALKVLTELDDVPTDTPTDTEPTEGS